MGGAERRARFWLVEADLTCRVRLSEMDFSGRLVRDEAGEGDGKKRSRVARLVGKLRD